MTFRVGQKVVYIGPDFRGTYTAANQCSELPKPGVVYTIRGSKKDGAEFLLEEIRIIHPCWPDDEVGIEREALRPIVERKTDISIFTAMLTDTKQRVRA